MHGSRPAKGVCPTRSVEALREPESDVVEVPAGQRAAIAEIVQAVREDQHWRVGVLLDQFVVDADLAALFALREALADAVFRRKEP
ncbi:hypothetical protein GCM10009837_19800 [Streptomyces durmitorensis]